MEDASPCLEKDAALSENNVLLPGTSLTAVIDGQNFSPSVVSMDVDSNCKSEIDSQTNKQLQSPDSDTKDLKENEVATVKFQNLSTNNVFSNKLISSDSVNQHNVGANDKSELSSEQISATEQSSSELADCVVAPSIVDSTVRVRLLARVAVSDAHFKHQQRGEPDLTLEEKIEIAQKILDENKVNFLSRFSQYLEIEDLEYFKDSRHIYEVDFYCKQIQKSKSGNYHKNRVKNRRYEAMKKLICEGEYFSEEEMKFRDPYLYNEMVGQYMTEEEVQAEVDKSDLRFSTILIRHMDLLDENARFAIDKDKEEEQMEEEEESDEESELESDNDNSKEESSEADAQKTIPEKERQELKTEFITIMQERFLSGGDKNFDYSKVDNNEQYDDLNMLNIEAEEKYFDDEDSASAHSLDSINSETAGKT